MRVAGWLLTAIGLLIVFIAWNLDTSVTTTVPSALGYGITDTQTVTNLAKQQQQLLAFESGAIAVLGGIVLIGAGELQATIVERSNGIARLLKRGLPNSAEEALPEPPSTFVAAAIEIDPAVEAARAEEAARRDAEGERLVKWVFAVVLILGAVIITFFLAGGEPNGRRAETALNSAALADNLEIQADNLEAEAAAILRNSR